MKYLLVVQLYGNLSITTATSEINETVESMSRFLTTNRNIELLEPYEGKLSRTVLRGERGSNALDLPDSPCILFCPRNIFQIQNPPFFFPVHQVTRRKSLKLCTPPVGNTITRRINIIPPRFL